MLTTFLKPNQKMEAQQALADLMQERLMVAHDVASAMEYIHDRGIIYRDLKSANVGFDDQGQVKLYDFGVSRFLPKRKQQHEAHTDDDDDDEDPVLEYSTIMSDVGTNMFVAPEVRNQQPYNQKADVYSFGVLLYEVLALATPKAIMPKDTSTAATTAEGKLDARYLDFEFPICSCWPAAIQDLFPRMLDKNPKNRPTMAEIRAVLHNELA